MICYIKAFLFMLGVFGALMVFSLLVEWLVPSWLVGLVVLGAVVWGTRSIARDMEQEARIKKGARR